MIVTLANTTRYKDSYAYVQDGQTVLGPFVIPAEFAGEPGTDWPVHAVEGHEVGFLDKIAVLYYGPGLESMWWCIAAVNGIVNPMDDMKAGQRIVIPPRDVVTAYIARRTRG